MIDARLQLLDASRQGLARVRQSIDDRRQTAAASEATERRRLDAAFDADVKRQSPLTDAWVIEARTAYAAALDAFATRQRRNDLAAGTDQADLAAIEAALQQLQSLDRSELRLLDLFGAFK